MLFKIVYRTILNGRISIIAIFLNKLTGYTGTTSVCELRTIDFKVGSVPSRLSNTTSS